MLVKNKAKTSATLLLRAQIILFSADGMSNTLQSRILSSEQHSIGKWRKRWFDNQERLLIAEKNQMKRADFKALIIELLSDEPRPGKPARFSPEQISQILSIACEKPEDSGRPITHWTSQEIAFEAQKRGIVTSISDSYVRKLLKKSNPSS